MLHENITENGHYMYMSCTHIVWLALGVQEIGRYNNMRLHSDLLNSTSPFPGTGDLCRNRLHHEWRERERRGENELPHQICRESTRREGVRERGREGREEGREIGRGEMPV